MSEIKYPIMLEVDSKAKEVLGNALRYWIVGLESSTHLESIIKVRELLIALGE